MSEIRPKFDVDEVEHWLDKIQALLPPEEYRRVAPLIQADRSVMAQVRQQGAAAECSLDAPWSGRLTRWTR